jgi:hypothetical protein
MDRMRSEAIALSPDWGCKLSVFWTDRRFAVGRFPSLDRVDYLDHAVAAHGAPAGAADTAHTHEHPRLSRDAPFSGWAERARSFARVETLTPQDRKAYLRALLYPGRLCYGWMTGLMGSIDAAVAFLSENPPPRLDIGSIVRALKCWRDAADPDPLFPLRTVLPSQIDACAALLDRRSDLPRRGRSLRMSSGLPRF